MTPGVREMRSHNGQRWRFDPGSFCLELLITGGPGPGEQFEILHAPDDLAGWLTGSRLAEFAPLEAADLRISPAELREVKGLRDLLWGATAAVAHGERPDPASIEAVNAAAGPPPRPRLDPVTGQRSWQSPVTGAQVLGAVARDAIDLLGGGRGGRLRECAGSNCLLLFLDTSRPGNRRWCSMERCGNRHKVRGYRSRHNVD